MKRKFFPILKHSLRNRCPRCGVGKLFDRFYRLGSRCPSCELDWQRDPVDLIAFMYLSTALLTGFGIAAMFLLTPQTRVLGRVGIGAAGLALILVTWPLRKSLAIGLDYWSEQWRED